MTSKERVKKAIRLQQPDMIPYGEFAVDWDTVEKVLNRKTYLRHKARSAKALWDGKRDEVVECWKKDAVDVVKKLDLDIAVAWLVPAKDEPIEKPREIDDTTYEYPDGRVVKYSPITCDFAEVYNPNAEKLPDISEFSDARPIELYHESCFEMLEYVIQELGEEKYILFRWGEEQATMVFFNGLEIGLMALISDPELVQQAIAFKTRQGNMRDQQLKKYAIDGVLFDMDFASNQGPFFSPKMFREFSYESTKSRCDSLHNLGFQVIRHACGNNWSLLDMFIESGSDCYQGIQNSAGMDIRELKQKYGKRLALWGGIAVEHLVSGTVENIYDDLDYALRFAAPDGGFILGASHSVAVGTKYENYMALLERFFKMRAY